MKVTLTAVLESKVTLEVTAEVKTFADLSKLARALDGKVKGVRKALPDMAVQAVVKITTSTEK